MKKLLLLSATALLATFASCGNGESNDSKAAGDSTNHVKAEAFESKSNIRYVCLDSIYLHYELAKVISQEAQGLQNDLQSYQAQLQNQLMQLQNNIQQKVQTNGYVSQAAYESDVKAAQNKANEFQSLYSKREQSAMITLDKRNKELKDSLDNFFAVYNATKKYDAILIRDAGVYFNPALDITDEVISGLNARYKGAKSTGDKSAAPANTPASTLTAPASPATIKTEGTQAITAPK